MKKTLYGILFVLAVLLIVFAGKSYATTISYQATNLADTIPGEDLWQYSYSVSGHSFNQFYGFTVLFDYLLYSKLEDPPPFVNNDWDPIVLQPDLILQEEGAYDALALVDNASFADPFTVSFVWLGSGVPGSQPFQLYDPNFETIESGRTTSGAAAIPEPATLLLLGSGHIGFMGIRKKLRIKA